MKREINGRTKAAYLALKERIPTHHFTCAFMTDNSEEVTLYCVPNEDAHKVVPMKMIWIYDFSKTFQVGRTGRTIQAVGTEAEIIRIINCLTCKGLNNIPDWEKSGHNGLF